MAGKAPTQTSAMTAQIKEPRLGLAYATNLSSLPEDIKLYKVCWQPSAETYEMVRTVGTQEATSL